MPRHARFRFSHARKVDSAYRYVSEAADAGVIFNTGQGANGRFVTVNGERFMNFGSCSYMALETLPQIRECAHRALDEYGTQFHFSRAYLQCELYEELETLLERIAGRPVLVAASTSLAHLSALPALVTDDDYLIVDQFAHASLHTAVHLVPDVPMEIIRHNRMDLLEARLADLRGKARKVWYIADGLYSMLGDFAPFEDLRRLLDLHDNLHLYIDDAHSTSWLGERGRGAALDHFAEHERVVVALSLNKAFSAAGGLLALPTRDAVKRVRRCGGPMLFSGPIQPPMLGAAVGSARVHVSDAFPTMQAELRARLELCVREMNEARLPFAPPRPTPIFQAPCDSPRVAFRVADLLKERGFYCCVCVFPAVPMNRPGLRFTVTRHNEPADIAAFVMALDECRAIALGEVVRKTSAAVSAEL